MKKLFAKISNIFSRKKIEPAITTINENLSDDFDCSASTTNSLRNYSDYYKLIKQVFAVAKSTNEITKTCAAQKWMIYDKASEDENEVYNFPPELESFLKKPTLNNYWDEFLVLIVLDLLIAGNLFCYFVFHEGAISIQRFFPGDVEIKGNNLNFEYFLNINGRLTPLDKKYLVHLKLAASPINPILGEGIIEGNIDTFRHVIDVLTFRKNFFKNGCNATGVFSKDNSEGGVISNDRLQKIIDAKYKGANRAGVPFVLPEKVKYEQIGLDTARLKISEELVGLYIEIMSLFGLPRFLMELGIKMTGQKFNNHAKQLQHYIANTITPILNKIAMLFDEAVGKFNPKWGFKFLIPSEIFSPEMVQNYVERGIFTPNEGRRLVGMPESDDPEMDKYYTQAGRVALGEKPAAPPPSDQTTPQTKPTKEPPAPPPTEKKYIANGARRVKSWRDNTGWESVPGNNIWTLAELDNEKVKGKIKKDFVRLGKASIDKKGKEHQKMYAEYLAKQYVDILRGLQTHNSAWEFASRQNREKASADWEDRLINWSAYDNEIEVVMGKAHMAVGEAAYANVGQTLTTEITFGGLSNPEVAKKIELLRKTGPLVNKVTREKLQAVLGDSLSNGLSVPDTAKAIMERFAAYDDDMAKGFKKIFKPGFPTHGKEWDTVIKKVLHTDKLMNRALIIARNEAAIAYTEFSKSALIDSGVVKSAQIVGCTQSGAANSNTGCITDIGSLKLKHIQCSGVVTPCGF